MNQQNGNGSTSYQDIKHSSQTSISINTALSLDGADDLATPRYISLDFSFIKREERAPHTTYAPRHLRRGNERIINRSVLGVAC